jgi:hypothetical protein
MVRGIVVVGGYGCIRVVVDDDDDWRRGVGIDEVLLLPKLDRRDEMDVMDARRCCCVVGMEDWEKRRCNDSAAGKRDDRRCGLLGAESPRSRPPPAATVAWWCSK